MTLSIVSSLLALLLLASSAEASQRAVMLAGALAEFRQAAPGPALDKWSDATAKSDKIYDDLEMTTP